MPQLIDKATPSSATTRTGFDGQQYDLVFSDEFEVDNRTFYPGDDPYWEAVDIWYRATNDMEWYDPKQITTRAGKLRILMESAPNHGLLYRSGMLQSWNKFCFTGGYIEVSMTLPGPNALAQGYVRGLFSRSLSGCCSLGLGLGLGVVAWGVDYGQPRETWVWRDDGRYLAIHVSHAQMGVLLCYWGQLCWGAVLDTTHVTSAHSGTRHSKTVPALRRR